MSEINESKSVIKTLVSLVLGFLLLIVVASASFYAGIVYGRGEGFQVIEVEVTREVSAGVGSPGSNAPQVEQPGSDGSDVTIQVTPVPEVHSSEDGVVESAPAQEGPPAADLTADDLSLLFEVWEIIDRDFDGDLPSVQSLNYALINAALESLGDDYTTFARPEVAARFREDMNGTFEGIGAFVRENEDGFVEIVRPMDNRPADLAGIKAGDLIIEVDGENIVGQSLDEVISKVRGPRDTQVTLGILRGENPALLQITITRARIEIPTVEYRMLEDEIGYIQLTSFNAIATDRLTEAMEALIDDGATGIILDLRDNPGGFLDTAVDIADLYLPESVILYEKNASGLDQTFRAQDGEIGEEIPLVVLVNAGSASASELVAGALRDNGRATLVGEKTFGKGSVQQLRNLSDGSELRVTIARWFTPNNVNISKEGITPDIEVILPDDVDLGSAEDPQLQQAIDVLTGGQ